MDSKIKNAGQNKQPTTIFPRIQPKAPTHPPKLRPTPEEIPSPPRKVHPITEEGPRHQNKPECQAKNERKREIGEKGSTEAGAYETGADRGNESEREIGAGRARKGEIGAKAEVGGEPI